MCCRRRQFQVVYVPCVYRPLLFVWNQFESSWDVVPAQHLASCFCWATILFLFHVVWPQIVESNYKIKIHHPTIRLLIRRLTASLGLLAGYPNVYMKKTGKSWPCENLRGQTTGLYVPISRCLRSFWRICRSPNTNSCWKFFDLFLVGVVEREI